MRREVIAKQMTRRRFGFVEECFRFNRVQLLEVGLAIGAGVETIKLQWTLQ